MRYSPDVFVQPPPRPRGYIICLGGMDTVRMTLSCQMTGSLPLSFIQTITYCAAIAGNGRQLLRTHYAATALTNLQ